MDDEGLSQPSNKGSAHKSLEPIALMYFIYIFCICEICILYLWNLYYVFVNFVFCICEIQTNMKNAKNVDEGGLSLSQAIRDQLLMYFVYVFLKFVFCICEFCICEICILYLWNLYYVFVKFVFCICEIYIMFLFNSNKKYEKYKAHGWRRQQ